MDHAVNHRPFMRLLIVFLLVALLGSELAHSASPAQAQAAAVADEQSLPAGLESAIRDVLGPDVRWTGPRVATQQQKLTAAGDPPEFNDQFGISVAVSGDTALVGAPTRRSAVGAVYVFVRIGLVWSQQATLTADDAAIGDRFGWSVAISGDTALVGAYSKNTFMGAAYVFIRSGTTWAQQRKLFIVVDAANNDQFGYSVALSGNTALVGAYGKNSNTGAVYVFTRSGTTWTEQQKLTASDAAAGDQFGWSVAVSGDTALVGAPNKSSGRGAAYVFARSGTTWSQQGGPTASDAAAGDRFGWSVALSGDTALVGAPNKNSSTGAAYVFIRSGTTWPQQQKLTADDALSNDQFGYAVALSGDTAVVGARSKNSATGAAYAFVRSGVTWTQQQTLAANDGAPNNQFGYAVAVSGDTALAGAPSKNGLTGAAYVFARSGTTWSQRKLTVYGAAPDDQFGYAVAVSGNTALVGVPNKNSSAGVAYVFTRSGTTWSRQQILVANDSASNNFFGHSVALDGDTALIGAYGRNSAAGTVYVFTRSGSVWTPQAILTAADPANDDRLGYSVALSGDTALVGAPYKNGSTGAVYIFTRSGTAWSQQQKLNANDGAGNDQFGYRVALSSDTAAVGAPNKDFSVGAVYVFIRSGSTWSQQQKLIASDGASNDFFGQSVAIDGDTVLAGAYGKNNVEGAGYVFIRIGFAWFEQARLTVLDPARADQLGLSVALSGDTALIGAPNKNNATGAVYIFTRSGTAWFQQQKLNANDAAGYDRFGYAVALNSDTALIGAWGKDSDTGAAYVFSGAAPTATPTNTPTVTATSIPSKTSTATGTPTRTPTATATSTATRTLTPTQAPAPRPDTIGAYKAGVWYLRNSNSAGPVDITVSFGGDASDLPVVGDWNGDGVDTIGIYRSSTGVMFLSNSNTAPSVVYNPVFGNPGDTPFAGRWDNTLTHDGIGVYRPSNGILYEKKALSSGVSDYFAIFGNPGDQGVAGDWNGDGFDSIGVYRPTGTRWYMTNNGGPSGITYSNLDFVWTIGTSYAVVGDWNGDRITTVGYLTATGNFVLHSTNAAAGSDTVFTFGPSGARPVAGKWIASNSPANLSGLIGGDGAGTYLPPTPNGGFE